MLDQSRHTFEEALLNGRFLININNLVSAPGRTGIQRVCYEFCTRWPHIENTIPFVELGPDRIGLLGPEVFEDIRKLFEQDDEVLGAVQARDPSLRMEPNAGWIGLISARNRIVFEVSVQAALDACRAVISLEESLNLDFYAFAARYRPEKIFNLCHDFLVWTHGQHFNVNWDSADNILLSLENRRRYRNNFFTSTAMREQYVTRINPGDDRDYFVIPPGADGLGRTYRKGEPASNEFVVVGTLEPRKQPILILEAFEALNSDGHAANLCFAGRMGWLTADDKQRLLKAFSDYPWVRWVDGPDDEVLRGLMQNARATIYLSLAEGFGSPPVESLALGTPCIVSAIIPSVLDMQPNGQVRIAPNDGSALLKAVRRLMDDTVVRALQDEIETLALPTWQGFVDGVASMIEERAPACGDPQPLGYAQTLELLRSLAQMRELSREGLIEGVLRALNPDVSSLEISRVQDEARSAAWTNVDVVLNLASRPSNGGIPSAFVRRSLQDKLGLPALQSGPWREWQAQFRAICREPDYRHYVKRVFAELHERNIDGSELESHLPDREVSHTRLHLLIEALESQEFRNRTETLIRANAPAEYFDAVEVKTIAWKLSALASLSAETAVDRALLIDDVEVFIQTASLDLTSQLPSQDQQILWRGWASRPRGRYLVLLQILTSRACLLKVMDPRVHLELIHDIARRAGVAGRSKLTPLQLAARLAKASGETTISFPGREAITGEGVAGRDGGVDRLIALRQNPSSALALATVWAMASGRAEWCGRLLGWARAQLPDILAQASSLDDGSVDSLNGFLRSAVGRPPSVEEGWILSRHEGGKEPVVGCLAILLCGLRRGELVNLADAMGQILHHADLIIEKADTIEALAACLEAVGPERVGQVFRTETRAPQASEPTGTRSAQELREIHFQDHADGDVSSVDQLLALEGEALVRMAYKKLLLREADSGGLANYVGLLNAGRSKAAVVRSLALSEEGRAKSVQLRGLQALLDASVVEGRRRKRGWKRLLRLKL